MAMEENTLAIPPGVVPSESKEDLYRQLQSEENQEVSVLKDVCLKFQIVEIELVDYRMCPWKQVKVQPCRNSYLWDVVTLPLQLGRSIQKVISCIITAALR